jgi:hypothetical protein
MTLRVGRLKLHRRKCHFQLRARGAVNAGLVVDRRLHERVNGSIGPENEFRYGLWAPVSDSAGRAYS